jgi:hypothetical protein
MSTLSGAEMASMAIQTLIYTGIRPVCLQDFSSGTFSSVSQEEGFPEKVVIVFSILFNLR